MHFACQALVTLLLVFSLTQQSHPSHIEALAQLQIRGEVKTPLTFPISDLKNMPRKIVKAFNQHENRRETYEGVAVQELLRRAGVPQNEKLRGSAMAMYIVAEASDGYRAVFALAELDSDFQDSDVIVADMMDGSPLGEKQGPFKMVAPHDKRPARWVRMLKSITVLSASPPN